MGVCCMWSTCQVASGWFRAVSPLGCAVVETAFLPIDRLRPFQDIVRNVQRSPKWTRH